MILASALGAAALVYAAAIDLMSRVIPNRAVLLVALAGTFLRVHDGLQTLLVALAIAVVIFSVMLVIFRFQLVGGGDVKLLAAASLLLAPEHVPQQMLLISIAGGGLALFWIISRKFGDAEAASNQAPSDFTTFEEEPGYLDFGLPYGVAICVGTLAIMALTA